MSEQMTGTFCHECKQMTGIAGHAPGCPVGRSDGEEVCNDE